MFFNPGIVGASPTISWITPWHKVARNPQLKKYNVRLFVNSAGIQASRPNRKITGGSYTFSRQLAPTSVSKLKTITIPFISSKECLNLKTKGKRTALRKTKQINVSTTLNGRWRTKMG